MSRWWRYCEGSLLSFHLVTSRHRVNKSSSIEQVTGSHQLNYKTELSWWIFALAGLLALGVALVSVSFQSWRAATRNPVESLRYE